MSIGARCTEQGRLYERLVATVCQTIKSPLLDIPLNTQDPQELGGCSGKQDIVLNFRRRNDIGMEVKRVTPDWMQMSICIGEDARWTPTAKVRIPLEAQTIFMSYVHAINFPVPPFLTRPITYVEWTNIKQMYKDRYHEVPNDIIARAYRAKNTHYIQVNGYGLYHTGEDVCGFGVPFFECNQYIRVRCKRHGKRDHTGKHVPSSVMMSFRPQLKTLAKSPYSLDSLSRIPPNLGYYNLPTST